MKAFNRKANQFWRHLCMLSGWWLFFIFTPNIGEDSHFDEHVFERGWFNHQLVMVASFFPSEVFFFVEVPEAWFIAFVVAAVHPVPWTQWNGTWESTQIPGYTFRCSSRLMYNVRTGLINPLPPPPPRSRRSRRSRRFSICLEVTGLPQIKISTTQDENK